jgi:NCS1 family nucleobase:cation symporter-1
MEKLKRSKISHWSNKLAVESEPNLTTAQLMLFNHDLKPVSVASLFHAILGANINQVEPERRQWGAWNFVGFWVADSFNINTWMISSSNIVDGLSWWQSWICVWVCMLNTLSAAWSIDVRTAWVLYCSLLRLHDRKNWCHIPHIVPCC